jgi:tetratricopeptide (TPR) repeat protein
MKTLIVALIASGLALGSCVVRAQAAPASEEQSDRQRRAAAHFERGVEFYREGSLDAALVEFERAYELIPSDRLLFNLAQIQAERHDYAAALGLFEKYARSQDAQISEARRAEARQEVARLRARVAYLWVSSNVAGAKLSVDDKPLAQLPLSEPLAINPGVCKVRVEKPGYQPGLSTLKVAAGEQPRLQLTLLPASSAVAPSASADDVASAPSRARYTPFWIASATTLALGGTTLALGLTAREKDQALSAALDEVPADPVKTEQARTELRRYSILTDSFLALSVVGVGVSIYFLVKALRAEAPAHQDAARRSVQVIPGHRGMALRATF